MRAADRPERDRGIAEAKAGGMTWDAVAATSGVSEKTARRAAKAHAARQTTAVVPGSGNGSSAPVTEQWTHPASS
jgi:transposase